MRTRFSVRSKTDTKYEVYTGHKRGIAYVVVDEIDGKVSGTSMFAIESLVDLDIQYYEHIYDVIKNIEKGENHG